MENKDLINRLLQLDTCAISDALDSLGLSRVATGLSPLTIKKRIAGKVITVKLSAVKPNTKNVSHLCTRAIEAASTGDIIVIEQRTGINAAGWGGVLSNAAKTKGIAGVIVDGPARDVDEAASLDFPVYARSATARTARGRIYEQEFGGAIQIGESVIHSGDFVLADRSGVVFLSPEKIEDVLQVAERIMAKEALMTQAVRAGNPVSQVMGADYESMLE